MERGWTTAKLPYFIKARTKFNAIENIKWRKKIKVDQIQNSKYMTKIKIMADETASISFRHQTKLQNNFISAKKEINNLAIFCRKFRVYVCVYVCFYWKDVGDANAVQIDQYTMYFKMEMFISLVMSIDRFHGSKISRAIFFHLYLFFFAFIDIHFF